MVNVMYRYTNNIQTRKILVDDEIYTNYCIIGITEEQAIIQKGNTITTIPKDTQEIKEIIPIIEKEANKKEKKTEKKTTKNNTKGE